MKLYGINIIFDYVLKLVILFHKKLIRLNNPDLTYFRHAHVMEHILKLLVSISKTFLVIIKHESIRSIFYNALGGGRICRI